MSGQGLIEAGTEALSSGASAMARDLGRRAFLAMVVGIAWLIGLCFAVAAMTAWLSTQLGVPAALAIMALALGAIGLAIRFIAARLHDKEVASRRSHHAKADGAEILDGISDNAVLGGTLFVSLIGFLLGRMATKS